MGSISMALCAAAGFLAAAPVPTVVPTFAPTYSKALSLAQEQKKPVAVFIGQGTEGFTKLVTDGGLTADAAKALKAEYVCLYVDATTEAGKDLAGSFQMTEGVILSDRSGGLQALRHEGAISPVVLNSYAVTYSQPALAVTQTSYSGRTSLFGATDNRPVMNAVVNVRDTVFPNAPGYIFPARSSCPNGRCPNAR